MNNNYRLVDFDGTLTEDTAWTPEECLKCKPRLDWIAAVNEAAKTKLIIIYTARSIELLPASLEWLKRNNVKYSSYNFGEKVPGVQADRDAINDIGKL